MYKSQRKITRQHFPLTDEDYAEIERGDVETSPLPVLFVVGVLVVVLAHIFN